MKMKMLSSLPLKTTILALMYDGAFVLYRLQKRILRHKLPASCFSLSSFSHAHVVRPDPVNDLIQYEQ